jgi:hypothetical protein
MILVQRKKVKERMDQSEERSWEERERLVLRLAKDRGGRLTVADVAMNSDLSTQQAQEVLSKCNVRGLTEMDVSDDGAVVYVFRGIA